MDEKMLEEIVKLATNCTALTQICAVLAQRVKEQELRIQTLEQANAMERVLH